MQKKYQKNDKIFAILGNQKIVYQRNMYEGTVTEMCKSKNERYLMSVKIDKLKIYKMPFTELPKKLMNA